MTGVDPFVGREVDLGACDCHFRKRNRIEEKVSGCVEDNGDTYRCGGDSGEHRRLHVYTSHTHVYTHVDTYTYICLGMHDWAAVESVLLSVACTRTV